MESFGIEELSSMTYNLLLSSLVLPSTRKEEWIESFPSFFSSNIIIQFKELFFTFITSTSSSNDLSFQILEVISKCNFFSDLYNHYILTCNKLMANNSQEVEEEEDELDSASVDSWNSLRFHIKNSSPKIVQASPSLTHKSTISPSLKSSHDSPIYHSSYYQSKNYMTPNSVKSNSNNSPHILTPISSSPSSLDNKHTSSQQRISASNSPNLQLKPYTSPISPSSKAAQIYTEVKYCDNQLTLEVNIYDIFNILFSFIIINF